MNVPTLAESKEVRAKASDLSADEPRDAESARGRSSGSSGFTETP